MLQEDGFVMKFIADAMLGRLARWLRMLGFDTFYYSDKSDAGLLKIARQQDSKTDLFSQGIHIFCSSRISAIFFLSVQVILLSS